MSSSVTCALELQAAGARGIGERLDAPVVLVARAVEGDALDALLLRLLRNALADQLGGLLVAAAFQLGAHFLLQARGTRNHLVALRGSDLRIDVAVGAMHGKPCRADFP